MALPPLLVELKAKANEAITGFHEFQDEAEKAAKKAEKAGGDAASGLSKSFSAMASVGKAAVLGIAGAAVAIGAEGIKSAMEYQESTAKIAANAGISQSAADDVGKAFLKTMGTSTFSAQQIATAFGPVAGQLKQTEGGALSAGDSMTVMKAAMDAAEASGTDLGTTTGALASIMQTYHLGVGQASSASDVLFNASKSLNLPIDQVAQGMDKLKGRLGVLAPSMTDTGALLEELGQHGITGTRGVGVMQTAMSTLLGGSKTTDTQLKSMGVTLTDSKGNFVGMGDVIAQLQPKLAGMNQAQQTLALTHLFGASSAQVMQQVIAGGAAGYKSATAAISQQGSATEAAEKMAHSWQGEIKTAKAALSDLEVVIGQKILPVLAKVVQDTTDVVKWFSKHKDAAIALGIVVGGVLVTAVLAYTVSMIAAAAATIAANAPILLIIGAVVAVGVGIALLAKNWSKVWGDIKAWAADAWHFIDSNAIQPLIHAFDNVKHAVSNVSHAFSATWDAIKTATSDAVNWIKGHIVLILTVALGPLGLAIGELATHWSQVWDAIKTATSDTWHFLDNDIFTPVKNFFTVDIPGALGTFESLWSTAWDAIKTAVSKAWDFLEAKIFEPLHDFFATRITNAINNFKRVFDDVWGGIKTAASNTWDFLEAKIFEPLHDFFAAVITNELHGFESLWHDVWSGIQKAVQDVWSIIKPILDDIKKTVGDVTGAVSKVTGIASGIGHVAGGVLSHLPHLATGGLVSSPTVAMIGESEPELVIPMSKVNSGAVSALPSGSGGNGGGGVTAQPVNVQINGQTIVSFLLQYQRTGGVVAISRNGLPLTGTT